MEHLGKILKAQREFYGYTGRQVYSGICSMATYSRIEGEDVKYKGYVMDALLSRVGIRIDDFCEVMMDEEESILRNIRCQTKEMIQEGRVAEASEKLLYYQSFLLHEDALQKQFFYQISGEICLCRKQYKKAVESFREALKCTVGELIPGKTDALYSIQELELICLYGKSLVLSGNSEDGTEVIRNLVGYAYSHLEFAGMPRLYGKLLFLAGKREYDTKSYDKAYELSVEGLEVLKQERQATYQKELTLLKAKAMKALHMDENQTKEEFFQAYYLYEFAGENTDSIMEDVKELERGNLY